MIPLVLVVFTSTFFADYAWARYIGYVGAKDRWHASIWAAVLYVLGAVAVVGYTANRWLIVPAVLGAFVGTAVGVKAGPP